jgi:stage III sporulation protein AF
VSYTNEKREIDMEGVYSWVKNIVYFLLIVKIMEYIVPSEKSGKYIKLFSGIVLIIILIQPFLKILDWDGKLNNSIIDISNEIDSEPLKNKEDYIKINENLSVKIYKQNIKERINYLLENEGYIATHIKVEMNENSESKDYGLVKDIFLNINKKQEDDDEQDDVNRVIIDPVIINTDEEEGDKTIKSREDILTEKKIKNIIINFYNLSSDNIHITID